MNPITSATNSNGDPPISRKVENADPRLKFASLLSQHILAYMVQISVGGA